MRNARCVALGAVMLLLMCEIRTVKAMQMDVSKTRTERGTLALQMSSKPLPSSLESGRERESAEAEENDARALQLAPANPRTIVNIAADYEAQERYAAAETELTKGLNLTPN